MWMLVNPPYGGNEKEGIKINFPADLFMTVIMYRLKRNGRAAVIIPDGFDKAKRYAAKELAERGYNIDLCGFPHEEEEIIPPHNLISQYKEKRTALNADIDRILAEIEGILGAEG